MLSFTRPLHLSVSVVACAMLACAASAGASPPRDIEISIKDHTFTPATLTVPAGTEIKLTVKNLDATPEEIESYPLGFEKVIAGNQSALIRIKALEKGTYDFFGEYHQATAQGHVVAE